MTINDLFHGICEEDIWDSDETWSTSSPSFSRCLRHTLLTWIPCAFMVLFALFEMYTIRSIKAKPSSWRLLNSTRLIVALLIIYANLTEFGYYIHKHAVVSHEKYPGYLTISPFVKAITFAIFALLLIYQKKKGAPTIYVPWLFLIVYIVCLVPTLAQLCLHSDSFNVFEFDFNIVYICLLLVLLFLSSFADSPAESTKGVTILEESENEYENEVESRRQPCPEDNASFLSTLTFWWFNSTAYLGYKRPLVTDDVFDLIEEAKNKVIAPIFEKNWYSTDSENLNESSSEGCDKRTSNRSMLKTIIKTIWFDMVLTLLALVVNSASTLLTPVLLQYLLRFMASNDPVWHGVFITVAMFLTNAVISISMNSYNLRATKIQLKLQGCLVNLIYKKSLRISSVAKKESTSGEVVNLMSVDVEKIVDLIPYFFYGFTAPILIAIAVWLLYNQLGYAAFGGLIFVAISIPITYASSHFSLKHQLQQMKFKDERLKSLNETLNGIKVLKLYAWEPSFIKLISDVRLKETDAMKRFMYVMTIIVFQWTFAPFAVAFITFALYMFTNNSHILTAEKIFVTLNLIEILNLPLMMLPQIVAYSVTAYVSAKRLDKYLNSPELLDYVTRNVSEVAVEVEDGCFQWDEENKKNGDTKDEFEASVKESTEKEEYEKKSGREYTLCDINIKVQMGSLHAIVGKVGSGKSSLLSAFLGEMEKVKGRVNIERKLKIAYVSQQAWIENLTLRDNILFGNDYEEEKFEEIIDACALRPDLELLPAADLTEIGEKGINLSGGQKQRVSLARACYSDADLYLFDDPLSAVDAHVAKHLFDHLLSSRKGLLRNKTRVLVTNRLDVLSKVDYITVLNEGRISEHGTYDKLMEEDSDFADFVNQFLVKKNTAMERQMSIQSANSDIVEEKKEVVKKDTLVEEETAEVGNVKLSVYKEYIEIVGVFWCILIIFGVGGYQLLLVSGNYWLSKWSNDNYTGDPHHDVPQRNYRFGIYALIGVLQTITMMFGNFAIVNASYQSSVKLHEKLLNRIFRSPMSFFETTPLGRIVNRFSKDMDSVDSELQWYMREVLYRIFDVFFSLIVIAMQTGVFVLILLPLMTLYYFIGKLYIPTSRQLQRLQSITRSPIYAHFSQTIQGVSTIRAFNAGDRFINESNKRVELNLMCFYALNVAYGWLGIFLNTFGAFVVLFVCFYATFQRDTLTAGMVGLSLTYAITLTWTTLYWLVRAATIVETNIVSVERISEYCQNEMEGEWIIEEHRPPAAWPEKGMIKFDKYATRYRPGLDLVLQNVSASINAREKIGIVGRTGAGKSTITLSLFRIIEAVKGDIVIDELNIAEIGLHDLRSKLTIIPQDPVVFSGTLRFNLDPFDIYDDHEIWEALKHSHLKQFVSRLDKGLLHEISEGGENLSVGQRQLMCLARALLRKSRILVLDEATAAVDLETDSLIQTTIQNEFSDSTILTIAHRIQTILDCDRVMVIDKGNLVEFGPPSTLLSNRDSIFYSLAKNAGIIP